MANLAGGTFLRRMRDGETSEKRCEFSPYFKKIDDLVKKDMVTVGASAVNPTFVPYPQYFVPL